MADRQVCCGKNPVASTQEQVCRAKSLTERCFRAITIRPILPSLTCPFSFYGHKSLFWGVGHMMLEFMGSCLQSKLRIVSMIKSDSRRSE